MLMFKSISLALINNNNRCYSGGSHTFHPGTASLVDETSFRSFCCYQRLFSRLLVAVVSSFVPRSYSTVLPTRHFSFRWLSDRYATLR